MAVFDARKIHPLHEHGAFEVALRDEATQRQHEETAKDQHQQWARQREQEQQRHSVTEEAGQDHHQARNSGNQRLHQGLDRIATLHGAAHDLRRVQCMFGAAHDHHSDHARDQRGPQRHPAAAQKIRGVNERSHFEAEPQQDQQQ